MGVTKGRIERQGKVCFGDASINVWEENVDEASFKEQVFKRIVQQLNRLGWTCEIPRDFITQYGIGFARLHRECSKGDLKGFLDLSGRHIEFEMWQGVNTPTRPDHGGRYESYKERVAPYLLRLEMYRTRNRIRDYLCNVFTGYVFDNSDYHNAHRPSKKTAMEQIQQQYAESWHFKGDWADWLSKSHWMESNRKSADGKLLDHGQRVWFFDRKGRILTGIAYYNINNMWWVWLGEYAYTNEASLELYTSMPENPRVKRNENLRRRRLEGELSKAVGAMNFERAAKLRDLIFPKNEPLYVVWSNKHDSYHCSNFCWYTKSLTKAGKFTAQEVEDFGRGDKVIPIEQA